MEDEGLPRLEGQLEVSAQVDELVVARGEDAVEVGAPCASAIAMPAREDRRFQAGTRIRARPACRAATSTSPASWANASDWRWACESTSGGRGRGASATLGVDLQSREQW